MAMCEKCAKSGYQADQMYVDPREQKFLGPCCATPNDRAVRPVAAVPPELRVVNLSQPQDLEYGVEISNRVGVKAYVQYAGLQLMFEKNPDQLKKWAQQNGLVARTA